MYARSAVDVLEKSDEGLALIGLVVTAGDEHGSEQDGHRAACSAI
jgi:hypothetical protein